MAHKKTAQSIPHNSVRLEKAFSITASHTITSSPFTQAQMLERYFAFEAINKWYNMGLAGHFCTRSFRQTQNNYKITKWKCCSLLEWMRSWFEVSSRFISSTFCKWSWIKLQFIAEGGGGSDTHFGCFWCELELHLRKHMKGGHDSKC